MGDDGRSYIFLQGIAANLPTMQLRLAAFGLYVLLINSMVAGLGFQFLDRYLFICR